MFDYFANPSRFMRIANQLLLPLVILSLTTGAIGLYFGLFVAPADYQQGDTVRIIYIHVPSAWLAYSAMSGLGYVAFFMLYGDTRLPILQRGQLPQLARFLPF